MSALVDIYQINLIGECKRDRPGSGWRLHKRKLKVKGGLRNRYNEPVPEEQDEEEGGRDNIICISGKKGV